MVMAPTPLGLDERQEREYAEQVEQDERARKANVLRLEQMFLSLGDSCRILASSRHDASLAEAKHLAAGRWERLVSMEAQALRDRQTLGERPRKRPSDPNDWKLPSEAVAKLDSDYEAETRTRQAEVDGLRKEAVAERKVLESLVAKGK
jgi:hypothetical protein